MLCLPNRDPAQVRLLLELREALPESPCEALRRVQGADALGPHKKALWAVSHGLYATIGDAGEQTL